MRLLGLRDVVGPGRQHLGAVLQADHPVLLGAQVVGALEHDGGEFRVVESGHRRRIVLHQIGGLERGLLDLGDELGRERRTRRRAGHQ